jgi:hypothetical protein
MDMLSAWSRITLYVLLALIFVFTLIVLWAQIGVLRGKPFSNPDGTRDDWREQKIFFGIAVADVGVAVPLCLVGIALVFLAPPCGLFLVALVSFWFLWANVMTTATSLRFEKPKITLQWLVVFPLGSVIGLAYIVWMLVHFDVIFNA